MARKQITISVPDQLQRYIEDRVREGGYGSVSEYFRELLREDGQRHASRLNSLSLYAVSPERTFRSLASAARRPR